MEIAVDSDLNIFDNTRLSIGEVAEWLKATDCKSVLSEYAGSNPALSTICVIVMGQCEDY